MNLSYVLKVVLYARFSSDLQRSESIDAQVRAMKKYCEQHGMQIVDIYVDENKHLAINEREAEAVRIIFDMFSKGYSYDEITSKLNQEKYYTKKGNIFIRNSIYSILTNEKYTGTYVFNKSSSKDMNNKRNSHKYKDDDLIIRIPNGCPQIVDNETFEKVQQRILENKHLSGMYNAKHRYLLTGFLFCGYCGKRLTGNRRYGGRNKSLAVTYRCLTHKDICISKEYNRFFLEDFVFYQIKEHFGYKSKVTSMYNKVSRYLNKSRKSLQSELQALTSKLITVNESIANITKAIEKGIYNEDIHNRLEELKVDKATIETEISKKSQFQEVKYTDDNILQTLTECKELIRQPTNPENRWFLKKVISKIVLYRDEVLIVLKTGLSVNDEFDTEIRATRKEIYDYGRRIKNAG